MVEDRKYHTWQIALGVVGVVLSTVLVAVAVMEYAERRSSIVAAGEIVVFELPPSVLEGLYSVAREVDDGTLRMTLTTVEAGDSAVEYRYGYRAGLDQAHERLLSMVAVAGYDQVQRFRSMGVFTIRNDGPREVRDLVFQGPSTGRYTLDGTGRAFEEGNLEPTLQLGHLRGQTQVTLQIWSDQSPQAFRRNALISHPDGVIPLTYAATVPAPRLLRLSIVYTTVTLVVFGFVVWFGINMFFDAADWFHRKNRRRAEKAPADDS
jgi:hypothetical protein